MATNGLHHSNGTTPLPSHTHSDPPEIPMGRLRWIIFGKTALKNFSAGSCLAPRTFADSVGASSFGGNLVGSLRGDHEKRNSSKVLFHLDVPEQLESPSQTSDEFSYAQFWSLVGRYAGHLQSLGLSKGDRVAGQVTKSLANYALYLGTLQLGAIYLPLNTDYTLSEIQYFLENAEPSIFVCRAKNLESYIEVGKSSEFSENGVTHSVKVMSELELLAAVREGEPEERVTPVEKDEVATICYTSGTTGKPKGAMITHGNLLSNAVALKDTWKISSSDTLLHSLPIYHVHGLFVALHPLILAHASVAFLPRFTVDRALHWLKDCNVMMGVPTYYTRLLQSAFFTPALLRHFRLFVSGSAPLDAKSWNEFKEKSGGHRILERYGMTEGQMVCSNPFDGERKPGTVGPPLPGVEARIQNGVLEYKGPNLFAGYWRMPEKTKAEMTEDGFFISGDLANIDEDGYVQILGRGKDLIISGGLNIYPKEIEDTLGKDPEVGESAVIGVPHPDFGEAVVAVVVPSETLEPGAQEAKAAEIIKSAKSSLAGYKIPKRIYFQESIPRNSMGKVQKNVLRTQFKDIFSEA